MMIQYHFSTPSNNNEMIQQRKQNQQKGNAVPQQQLHNDETSIFSKAMTKLFWRFGQAEKVVLHQTIKIKLRILGTKGIGLKILSNSKSKRN